MSGKHLYSFRRLRVDINPLIIALSIGVIGVVLITASKALTPTAAVETEDGSASGTTSVTDASASHGKAIQFGVGTASPTGLHAFTGGADIAVMWDKSTASNLQQYTVYRNGTKIATTAPTGSSTYHTFDGTRYYDSAVTAGQTYSYQVTQTLANGATSPLSAPISVTQPVSTTPVPIVNIDTSAAPDLAAYAALGKAAIQTWYPKEADLLARPDYTPLSTINITFASIGSSGDAGYTSGPNITLDIAYARAHPDDLGIFVHESTHTLQNYTTYGYSEALVEGMPAWVTNNMFHDNDPRPPAINDTYNDGYDDAAYFLKWIMATYNQPSLLHNLNVAAHNNVYSDSLFKQYTGKTIGQLWTQMTGQKVSSAASLTGIAGKCADVMNADTDRGTPIQILSCRPNNPAQTYIFVANPNNTGAGMLQVYNKCLDVYFSGTADGTVVQLWDCNNTAAQQWTPMADGSLVNLNSGKCLQPTNGASDDFTHLVISTCNGSAAQKWAIPPA